MPIVVESTADASVNSASSLTITKPTGLAEGDLLVAILCTGDNQDSFVSPWNTQSGWSLVETNSFFGGVNQSVQLKVADSSDVAASNFSFTTGSSNSNLSGALLRVTGAASGAGAGDAVGLSDTYSNATGDGSTFAGTITPYTPPEDGSLIIAMYGVEFDSGSGNRSFSSYSVTSGVTLTELYDTFMSDGSGGVAYAATYGVQATATELSAFGASIQNGGNEHFGTFVVLTPPIDATGTNTPVTTDTSLFTGAGTADTVGSTNLLTTDTVLQPQSGQATVPQVWTTTPKA